MFDTDRTQLSTKERLVLKAAELLVRQSFGTVSVDDMCRATDIKKGTFYHHFPSKHALVLAAYDTMWVEGRRRLDSYFDPAVPPLKRLESYAVGAYTHYKEIYDAEGKVYGCPLASAGYELGSQDDEIRTKMKTFMEGHCAYLESAIKDLPQFKNETLKLQQQVAREMFSYVMGVIYQAKISNDPAVIQRDFLSGLKRLIGED